MPSHRKGIKTQAATKQSVPSKDMDRLPENFAPVFFQNQFRTKIELPTRQRYPDVKGKCAIITGSNSGLGLEAARQLLSLGLSHLILGVRSIERGNQAVSELRLVSSSARIEVYQLDKESFDSIQAFVRRCQETLARIDMIILNAGIAPVEFAIAPGSNHEKTVQVNHFATALLTVLFLPILKSKSQGSDPPRITIVNSVMAHLCKVPNRSQRPFLLSFDDKVITPWDPQERYGASKLLCQLFIVRLTEHVASDQVIINMVDPGLTKGTGLSRDTGGVTAMAAKMFFSIAGRPVDRSAATYVDAVLGHGKETHGCFLMNCQIAPLARWYYTDGQVLADLIWTETLQELSFAGLEQIIASMQSPNDQ
ncbi:putative short-chain dehydrogenase/reductase family protein [Xylariales sp. AK1849]|nr:putative short-chain dehydrogenase/reductase family protein [Xylariales sp. AK1849]